MTSSRMQGEFLHIWTLLHLFPHLGKAYCARQVDLGPPMLPPPSQDLYQLWAETNSCDYRVVLSSILLALTNHLCSGNGYFGSCNNDYSASFEILPLF